MEIENTRKRFKKRIEFERQILTSINSISNDHQSLNGLSDSAISVWKHSNNFQFKEELSEQVASLSKDLMIFCDTSKSTFDLDKRINSSEMNRKIDALKIFVKDKRSTI
jgi:hypothetical protein